MLDKKSPLPIYYQVKVQILGKIQENEYKVGTQLPTDLEFCKIFDTSRITIRRALSELEQEGYIERIQGKGSYVKFQKIDQSISKFYTFYDEINKIGMIPSSKILKFESIKADSKLANILGLNIDDSVILVERLRLANDIVIAYDTSYFPKSKFPSMSKVMIEIGSLYEILETKFGITPTSADESIEAISIREREALSMGVDIGSSQLLVKRLTYSGDDIIEYNYRIVNSSIYKYKITLEKF